MEKLFKISFVAITAVLLAFSLLILIMSSTFETNLFSKSELDFYSKDFSSENAIFVLGSSQLNAVNTTSINNIISKNHENYVLYNLAIGGDRPSKRIHTMEEIIDLHPKLIIYSVGFRDFETPSSSGISKIQQKISNSILPDPSSLINDFFQKYLIYDMNFDYLSNPKLSTLQILRNSIFGIENSINYEDKYTAFPNTPFFKIKSEHTQIRTLDEIIEVKKTDIFNRIDINNYDVQSFKKILDSLQRNNIKVIIFTTPYHATFYSELPIIEKEKFENFLINISSDYNIPIYMLHENYIDLDSWFDHEHLAVHKKSQQYSNDIITLILRELN